MSIVIREEFGREFTRGDSPSGELLYMLTVDDGSDPTNDELEAAVSSELTANKFDENGLYDGMAPSSAIIREVGPSLWRASIRFGPLDISEGDVSVTFTTTGGSVHITHSISNRGRYVPSGGTVTDHGRAVGVTMDGGKLNIEGCDVPAPILNMTLRTKKAPADVPLSYIKTLAAMTPSTNNATFYGFDAGELLFNGADGSREGQGPDDLVDITYSFSASENAYDLDVGGGITVAEKRGWDYLWFETREKEDSTSKRLTTELVQANVDVVIPERDFGALEI